MSVFSTKIHGVLATWFEDKHSARGQRVFYGTWHHLIEDWFSRPDGVIRTEVFEHDDRTRGEIDPDGEHRLVVFSPTAKESANVRYRMRSETAYLMLGTHLIVMPVRAADYRRTLKDLGRSAAPGWVIGFPFDYESILDCGGDELFDPNAEPVDDATCFMLPWEKKARERDRQAAPAVTRSNTRSLPPSTAQARLPKSVRAKASPAQLAALRAAPGDSSLSLKHAAWSPAPTRAQEAEPWSPMLPSVVIEPLATILCKKVTLHGNEVRYEGVGVARFRGTAQQLEALGGATAHRVLRALLAFQRDMNEGEIVGGVAELARRCGTQWSRTRKALEALTLLDLEGAPVLRIGRRRRRRAHVLRVQLLGALGSGYFAAGKVSQTAKGRRLVPVPLEVPPVTCNDLAASQMSYHLLLLGHARERGFRRNRDVYAELRARDLNRMAELAGLDVGWTQELLLGPIWKPSVMDGVQTRDGLFVIVRRTTMPHVYEPLAEGIRLTQRARRHRRGRRLPHVKKSSH